MRVKANLIVTVLNCLFIFGSCHRDKEMIGPEYIATPTDFYVKLNSFKASASSVNFESSQVYFNADFSSKVTWFITIRGLKSGAVKKISGLSSMLNSSNTTWNGSHDDLNFFQMNENAVAELSFLGSSLVLRDTIAILRAKKYNSQGVVIADDASVTTFEGFEGTYNFNSPTWTYGVFSDPGELIFGGLDSITPQFQGRHAFTIHGNDVNQNFFIGGLKRVLSVSEYLSIPADPNNVYVNIFLYGTGNPNSYVNYTFEESDSGMGAHIPNKDDAYQYQFSVSHTGWKLFYVKYSQLSRSTNASYGGSGNGIREPNKLRNVAFNLISSPAGSNVKVTFDMPIITFGQPFNPNE
jgi:hypothetical protein